MKESDASIPAKYQRRPGPFGPAWALLPKGQQLLVLEDKTLASDAIERMVDNGFSQLPVKNAEGRIIGVFSWQSFGKRVTDLRATKIQVTELPIRQAMEPARFIGPEVYIDTETDWSNIDYVLVGAEDSLLGLLCIADVFGRLNDFAEAFVLLYEIENEIRDLILDVVGESALSDLIANMYLPPNTKLPQGLKEFTFTQYKSLICARSNWSNFEPVFDTRRDLVVADFGEVNELRNDVFHFRRGITPKDTDRLRRFRDRLCYNRELFRGSQVAPAVR